ncbi:MAG: hypothetical protein JOY77_08760, partial [Alphaproteobacteria bacterium]|nr:hypothetical protein [Alphaproteobacteria bacterium]
MDTRKALLAATIVALQGSSVAWASRPHGEIVISNDPTQNMTCSAGVCSPTNFHAVLNVTDLENLLAASDLTVSTQFLVGHRYKDVRNIRIAAPLSWSTVSKLSLGGTYGAYVKIDAPVSVLGGGGLVISGGAAFVEGIAVTFSSTNSVFSIGGHAYTLAADFPTLASGITANPSGYFALAGDYDAANDQFSKAPIESFSGVFLGLGHTISDLTIQKGRKLCQGMIAANQGYISYFSLSNLTVLLDRSSQHVGGVTGCNGGSISHVAVSGQISGSGQADAGGVAGINDAASIALTRSSATVRGGQAGGIAGQNDWYIYDSFASGSVNGVIDSGGLVGNNSYDIESSYATGSVSGSKNNTGGFAGSNRGSITNSYAMGSVNGAGGAAGGFVGYNVGSVEYAYSIGAVTGSKKYTGGFAGYDANEAIDTAYWDVDTSGFSNRGDGAGFPKYDPGITGLTSNKLQSGLLTGFDKRYWRQNSAINGGYPF